jgi:hypothetical protein
MANSYHFLSVSAGLVMDVKKANTTPPADIQIYTQHTPAHDNQLWTFEPSSANPGYFFIKSKLGHNLVIDVNVDVGAAADKGDKLQTNTQNSNDSQLWRLGGLIGPIGSWITIESLLGHHFVVDVVGNKTAPKTPLNIWPYGSAKLNQLWFLVPESTNTYKPSITAVPAPGGFTITGADFQPGTQAMATYLFSDPITGYADSGNFVAGTDFGGGFVSDNPAASLASTSSGVLAVQVFLSAPPLAAGGVVSWSWDGTKFTKK